MTLKQILAVSTSPAASQDELEAAARAADALRRKAEHDVRRAERAYREVLISGGADPRQIAEIRSAAAARLDQLGALVDRLDARLLAVAVAALHTPDDEDNLNFSSGGSFCG